MVLKNKMKIPVHNLVEIIFDDPTEFDSTRDALDLVIAWIVTGIVLTDISLGYLAILMLIASAILLAIVTWLGQKHAKRLIVN